MTKSGDDNTEDIRGKAVIKVTPHAVVLTGHPPHFDDKGPTVIEKADVASAVNACAKYPECIGFRLMSVFQIVVTPDSGPSMEFYQEKKDSTIYVFADRLITRKELTTNVDLKSEFDRLLYVLPQMSDPLYIDGNRQVQQVPGENYKHTVLIDRTGQEIWRAPHWRK